MERAAAVAGLLVISIPVYAQFNNLVTNDDGSVLYFSSSLRMRGTQQFDHPKLFIADSQGVRLHTQRDRQEPIRVPESAWPVSNYFSIEAATMNGDGSEVGVIASRVCYGGSGCLSVPVYRTEISGREFGSKMSLSRNGRFALLWGDKPLGSLTTLIDLSSGERFDWGGINYSLPRHGRRRVTSDGTALSTTVSEPERTPQLRLVRLDGSRAVAVPDFPLEAVIDDGGDSAVYEAAQTGNIVVPSTLVGRKLVHVDLGGGTVRFLAASAVPMQPCLSNDGQVVLYLADAEPGGLSQAFLIRVDGSGLRQLTRDRSGIKEIVLSGNGKVAYAVSEAGRLFRLNVESGVTEQIIGRSMVLNAPSTSITPYPVPGSAFVIGGAGLAEFADSTAPPLPSSLNGLELLLDGRSVPLQSVAPTRVVFQMPWDVSLGKHRLEAKSEADSIFEAAAVVETEVRYQAFVQFELLGDSFLRSVSGQPYALAAHEDFSSIVTSENRAKPGGVIHLYMTGLGPVDAAVEPGAPSPSIPPAHLQLPLSCHFAPKDISTSERPVEILFAGLAPGLAGYYQLTIRIPPDVSIMYGDALIVCGFPNPGSGSTAWIPIAEQ